MPKGGTISRLQRMQGQAEQALLDSEESDEPQIKIAPQEVQEIPFPELIEGSEYLVPLFHSAGTVSQSGMGLAPLTWQEIKAWKEVTDNDLSVWEIETIKRMSDAYAGEYSQASDPNRPQPYIPKVDVEEIDRIAVASKVVNTLAALLKKKD